MTSTVPDQLPADLAARLEAVSAERMRATVHELAADRYAGRRVGTPGGHTAASWLAERLGELGAETELSGFDVANVRELYATPVLEWSTDGRTHRLEHRRDFVEHLASADLPHPHPAPLAGHSEADLHGRWVLAEAGDWARACEQAEAQGAAGVLTARGTDAEGWMPKMIAGPAARRVPVIALRTEVHARLAEALSARPVQVTGSMPLRRITTRGQNVNARFPHLAQGGVRVLLTAHYDGVGDDPTRRMPAAADNASGVAAVLEAARVLSTTPTPGALELTVAFLDAEEAGAWGSAHHAAKLPPDTLVINLDGAAHLREAAAVEAGGPAHALLATLDQAARLTGLPLRAGAMASDNRRYAAAGLASIGIGMGMPGYQTPAETPDRVEPGTLVAAARLLVAATALLVAQAA